MNRLLSTAARSLSRPAPRGVALFLATLAATLALPPAAQAAPTKIAFVSASFSVGTGQCSPEVTLQLQDASGAAASAPQNIAVAIAGPAGYFTAADCSGDPLTRTAMAFAQGQSTLKFHFIHPRAGALNIVATSPSFTTVSQSVTVTLAAGVPAAFAFTGGPVSLPVGTCTPAIPWVFKDAAGNPAAANRTMLVLYEPSSSVEFFSEASCSTASLVLSLQAAPGTTGGQVFAKSAVLGSVPFKITSPGLDFDQFSLSATGSTGGCTSVGAAWPAVAGLFFLLRRRRRA